MLSPRISVCINTRNRTAQLKKCLGSIHQSVFHSFEIIIIDQSDAYLWNEHASLARRFDALYFPIPPKGVGVAKNMAIKKSSGKIVAFTDDDCIVDSHWLDEIWQTFQRHPNVSAVFGKTLPYQSSRHKYEICPCTFTHKLPARISQPGVHYKTIGFGNNMAFRSSVFTSIGMFKPWLGPGSIGKNAEDAEFALRLLLSGKQIFYTPTARVFHAKWLTAKEMRVQELAYSCGEMACYGYFYFSGHAFAIPIIRANIRSSVDSIKNVLKRLLLLRWNDALIEDFLYTITKMAYRLWGALIGYLYARIDPLLQ